MKHFVNILVMSTLFVVVGCAKENISDEADVKVDIKQLIGREITIHATMEEKDDETKTALNAGAVLWLPGDAISLFYGSGTNGGSQFTSTATEPSNVTNFSGTITAITGGADVSLDDTFFWGVYPYRDDTSCDGSSVTMTLPTQQTAVAGTFATGLFPSLGRSQGLYMGFYNICGGWRFSVAKEGVRKVTLKTNGGEYITGKVKVGLNASGIPVVQEIIDGSDEVVLECPRGEYFEVGQTYYMVLLPGTCASGFTMTFETYTEAGVYNRTASTTITRSKFSGITNIDNYLTTPYAQKTGNIPVENANFKAYLVANFDTNDDGEISYAEAALITQINTSTTNIASVQGIEYMLNLKILSVPGQLLYVNNVPQWTGQLVFLDVSNNTKLQYIVCPQNHISSIDLSHNSALTSFNCEFNELTSLSVSNNIALTELSCGFNQIASLDLSVNTELTDLVCSSNPLNSLDLSNNRKLTRLLCASNQLSTLNLSNNEDLEELHCSHNQFTTLDVSNNTQLKYYSCESNMLTSLNLSGNTELMTLSCFDNQLTSIDVSNNTELSSLNCSENQIASIDISNNTKLTMLSCSNTQITSLDVSHNTALTSLICWNSQLTSLDLTANPELELLHCYNNQITSLDVSHNLSLNTLDCSPMVTLETLFIAQGQEIPNVTTNRSAIYIPAQTQIVIAPVNGGNEGAGDEEVNP